jgi:hypothetical protein
MKTLTFLQSMKCLQSVWKVVSQGTYILFIVQLRYIIKSMFTLKPLLETSKFLCLQAKTRQFILDFSKLIFMYIYLINTIFIKNIYFIKIYMFLKAKLCFKIFYKKMVKIRKIPQCMIVSYINGCSVSSPWKQHDGTIWRSKVN